MREILFRAKRLDNGEWIEGCYLKSPCEYTGFLKDFISVATYDEENECGSELIYKVDPETVCQYTGMTDKNGSKVWENDIIQMFYRDGETNVGTIRYTDECVRFQYYEGNIIGYGIDMTCDMEVIGNVFDNPELLKGGAK